VKPIGCQLQRAEVSIGTTMVDAGSGIKKQFTNLRVAVGGSI
jgi:hypothetical protein